eukprot:scaffold5980_cov192-Amphora_coffeaeformis.AAC.7
MVDPNSLPQGATAIPVSTFAGHAPTAVQDPPVTLTVVAYDVSVPMVEFTVDPKTLSPLTRIGRESPQASLTGR